MQERQIMVDYHSTKYLHVNNRQNSEVFLIIRAVLKNEITEGRGLRWTRKELAKIC